MWKMFFNIKTDIGPLVLCRGNGDHLVRIKNWLSLATGSDNKDFLKIAIFFKNKNSAGKLIPLEK